MDKESVVFVLIVPFVIACVLVFVVPTLIEWQKRKKWKKMYDSVQVGDKYIVAKTIKSIKDYLE